MNHVRSILDHHPNRAIIQNLGNLETLLNTLTDCALTCNVCADACSAEPDAVSLRRCIRLNADCVEVCTITSTILTRVNDPNWDAIRHQVQACLAACRACAEECERHAKMHAHCRVCAEACRACERACQQVLGRIPAPAMA